MKKQNIGSSFDSWLREEGLYEDVCEGAMKRNLTLSQAQKYGTGKDRSKHGGKTAPKEGPERKNN
jgi:hypothetical protein